MTEDIVFKVKDGSVIARLSDAGTFISVHGRTIRISGDGVTVVSEKPSIAESQPGDRPCA
jgi:hypothetical protein